MSNSQIAGSADKISLLLASSGNWLAAAVAGLPILDTTDRHTLESLSSGNGAFARP
jgi:hypothetical protein